MTSWKPDESIIDRFAIHLPLDAPAGEYEVWTGIYHPESGIRLHVAEGIDAGPDFVIVGRVTVITDN